MNRPTHRRMSTGLSVLATLVVSTAMAGVGAQAVSQAAPPPAAGGGADRIIGGKLSVSNPGAAFLMFAGDKVAARCTGSLIAPQWVLTAEHCRLKAQDNGGKPDVLLPTTLRVGSLKRDEGGELVKAVQRVDAKGADVSLLKLDKPVTSAPVIKLATQDPSKDTEVTIYGWGGTQESQDGSKTSPDLKEATMTVSRSFSDSIGGPGLWLTGKDGSSYFGDSGGPAMAGGVQIGVCSSGSARDKISIYASVAKHQQWIQQTIGTPAK